MEEEKSLLSQKGYFIDDPIAFTIAVRKAGSVKNLINNLNDLEQKAIQETAKKEISVEDFQSFSANVNTYLDVFEKAFLANEKEINQESSKEVSEIEKHIQSIRDSFKDIEECRISEKAFRKQKEEFDEIKRQIIEYKNSPSDEANMDSRNQSIELLAEKYGPSLDAFKSAEKDYESKKSELEKYIKKINVQNLKNDLFKQLASIEDNFKQTNLYEIKGIADALQNLRGGIEMEIGMFGITLEDEKSSRIFEESCKRFGVRKNSSKKVEFSNTKVEDKKVVVKDDLDEEQIKKDIMAMTGLLYASNEKQEDTIKEKTVVEKKSEPQEEKSTEEAEKEPEIPSVPFEMPFVDSIASQLEDIDKKEEPPVVEQTINNDVFEIPTIEDTKLYNPLDYIDSEFAGEEKEEPVLENQEEVVQETPVVEEPIINPVEEEEALLDEYDVPEAAYENQHEEKEETVAEAVVEEPVIKEKEVVSGKPSLRKKIKGIRKSVSNKYLKSIMTAGAISGIAEKLTSSKVAEAVINADFASGVEKLASKMKTFGGLSEEVYVKDASKSPKDQISEIASIAKDKFLSVYTSIKAKLKSVATAPTPDNQQLTNNVEEQLTNAEGAVR